MKKYTWDLLELRNKIITLEKLYKQKTNTQEKELIEITISIYKNMIDLVINNNKQTNELMTDDISYIDLNDLINQQIEEYQLNNKSVLDIILQSYIPFINTYKGFNDISDVSIAITNQDIISIANDFSNKMLPDDIKKEFNNTLNNNSHIHIQSSKQNSVYSGTTIFEPIFNEKYIFISRNNTLIDIVTLPHEIFHYIFNNTDVGITLEYNMHYTTEIEGSFANILFGEYFYNNSIDCKNYFNKYFLESYHDTITQIVVRNSFLNSIKDNKKFRMNKFNKELSYWEMIPFDNENEIINYLNVPLDVNMKYTLGYLAAIDLYYIYQNDPELAFYLLKNIRFIKRENDIANLFRKNHLTFMDDGYENLKKYTKKIERQN